MKTSKPKIQDTQQQRSDLEDRYLEFVVPTVANDERYSLEQPLPPYVKIIETVTTYGACEEPVI